MKNLNGSCVLLLTLISSVILIYALNAFCNATFNLDIARQKYEFEFNFRNIESLHNYGLFLYLNNPSTMNDYKNDSKKGNAQRVILHKGIWPAKSHKASNSIVVLTIENDIYILQSRIKDQILETKIKKIENNKIQLYDWKYRN